MIMVLVIDKERLNIEIYGITQATLEQVCIMMHQLLHTSLFFKLKLKAIP